MAEDIIEGIGMVVIRKKSSSMSQRTIELDLHPTAVPQIILARHQPGPHTGGATPGLADALTTWFGPPTVA
jgi:hypothetical protein